MVQTISSKAIDTIFFKDGRMLIFKARLREKKFSFRFLVFFKKLSFLFISNKQQFLLFLFFFWLKTNNWKVFSLFSEYTFSFWEGKWKLENLDVIYNDYIKFIFLLTARCTTVFPLEKYRAAIPVELRSFLSYIRALSFHQLRTKSSELKNEVIFLKKSPRMN
jgi:hypothetical protein